MHKFFRNKIIRIITLASLSLSLIGCAMMDELEEIELKFNRPFLYQVVSSNNIPLFTGIVSNPTMK
ncbi:MAG: hypothetical protein PUC65_11140 [Clostridiales bacterium]|nr:hypothetical protein [Clostridiales bacterium]